MIDDLNIIDFWKLGKNDFVNRLSNTAMNDQWYNTLETYLMLSESNTSISVECLTWLLEESLDLETHMIIVRYYPYIVKNSYNWLSVVNKSKFLLSNRQTLISTVSNYINIVK